MGAAVLSGWQLGLVQGESSVALGIYETGSSPLCAPVFAKRASRRFPSEQSVCDYEPSPPGISRSEDSTVIGWVLPGQGSQWRSVRRHQDKSVHTRRIVPQT